MTVKIKDIAEKTGVSLATVSLVLNHKTNRVSEKKKQEIIETAKKLGYQANMAARSLVQGISKTIGFILLDLENYFFASLAQHVELLLRDSGYALFIMSNNEKVVDDDLDYSQVNRHKFGNFFVKRSYLLQYSFSFSLGLMSPNEP